MLISKDYRNTLIEMHKQDPNLWGARQSNWACIVTHFIRIYKIKSVLDFGCGKGMLKKEINSIIKCLYPKILNTFFWNNYDPGIEKYNKLPQQNFDMITCTDVLEHIEPEFLDETINYIYQHIKKIGFFVINFRPERMHLIVESSAWWIGKISQWNWNVHLLFNRYKDVVIWTKKNGICI